MWIATVLEAFFAINYAPAAIGSATVVAMATAGLIITERRKKQAKNHAIEDEDSLEAVTA